jgi:hypothetical protein
VSYELFNTKAEAQEKCDALNAETGHGIRNVVDEEVSGQR